MHRYVPDLSVALVDMRAGTVHLLERVPAKNAATAKTIGFGFGVPYYYTSWARGALGYDEGIVKIDAVRARNFQVCFWRGTPGGAVVDPDMQRARVICGGEYNWSQFCDADIDRLTEEGGKTLDAKKRHDVQREVLRLIQERAYLGTGILVPLVTAYRREVHGLRFDFQVPDVRAVWLRA